MVNGEWEAPNHHLPFTIHYLLTLHRGEELGVVLGLAEAFEDDFHLLDGRERVEHPAHDPDAVEVLLREEQLFLARARALEVDGREEALVGEPAVEVDFRVAGALELLEDDVVHARAGVDERGRDDGQGTALLDVARRAEEALRA